MLPNILQYILGSTCPVRLRRSTADRQQGSPDRRNHPGPPTGCAQLAPSATAQLDVGMTHGLAEDPLLYRVQDVTGNHLTLSPSAAPHIATVSQSLREGCRASCRLAGRPMQGYPGHSRTINGDQVWVACARGRSAGGGRSGMAVRLDIRDGRRTKGN